MCPHLVCAHHISNITTFIRRKHQAAQWMHFKMYSMHSYRTTSNNISWRDRGALGKEIGGGGSLHPGPEWQRWNWARVGTPPPAPPPGTACHLPPPWPAGSFQAYACSVLTRILHHHLANSSVAMSHTSGPNGASVSTSAEKVRCLCSQSVFPVSSHHTRPTMLPPFQQTILVSEPPITWAQERMKSPIANLMPSKRIPLRAGAITWRSSFAKMLPLPDIQGLVVTTCRCRVQVSGPFHSAKMHPTHRL